MLINNTSKAIFNGNGMTTEFPFSFKVWDIAQLIVTIVDDKGFESPITNFTTTLNDNGGSVIYLHNGKPLPTGYNLVILRNMPFTQNIDLITGTRFDPQVIEDALDKATAERQQLQEAMERSIKIGVTSTFTADELLQQIFTAQSESANSANIASESVQATLNNVSIATEQANCAKAEADRAASATGIPDNTTIIKNADNELSVKTTAITDILDLPDNPTPEQIAHNAKLENYPAKAIDVKNNKIATEMAQARADEALAGIGDYRIIYGSQAHKDQYDPNNPKAIVDSALGANGIVSTYSKYTLQNPFGANTPVLVVLEIYGNFGWGNPLWVHDAGGGGRGFSGAAAHYIENKGIVVQTCANYLCAPIAYAPQVASDGIIHTAPCRIHVWKIGD